MQKSFGVWVVAAIALAFGALTILSGGRTLFGGAETLAAAGNVVPFVLWFNFLSGFAYMAAGIGILRSKDWGRWIAVGLAVAIIAG